MRFGLFLNTPSVWPIETRLDTILAMAAKADERGFSVVVAPQHYADTSQKLLQPLPLLGRLSGATTRVQLGTGVVLAGLLNPYDIAESMATVDILSGGRALLGVGAGHRQVELNCFGVERGDRGRLLEDCVATVRRLWAVSGDPLAESTIPPISLAPIRRRGIPIWVAGTSDAGVRRAARVGDAWYAGPGVKIQTLERQCAVYRAELDRCGRPCPAVLPLRRDVFLTVDAVRRAALPDVLQRRYAFQQASRYADDLPAADRSVRTRLISSDAGWMSLVGDEVIAGDLDECRAQLSALSEQLTAEPLLVLRIAWPDIAPWALLKELSALSELVSIMSAK